MMAQQRRKCGLAAGLLLGLLVVGIPCYASSPQYEATAMIQVRSAMPSLFGESRQLNEREYIRFVNTQVELLRSPPVLDSALENADVARLPIVVAQQDRRAWLADQLRLVHVHDTEIVRVSIVTNSAEASEKIVNAVIDAYFNFINEGARQVNNQLIASLRIEERRQRQIAQTLRERIRTATREAAIRDAAAGVDGMSIGLVGESLERDIALAETRLTTMRAERKAVVERMENPDRVPVSVLMQMHPERRVLDEQREIRTLKEQREGLVQRRENRAETLDNPDADPRIMSIDQIIEALDARLEELVVDVDSRGLEALQNFFRLREEVNLFNLDQEIRTQEILVKELTNRYNEQLLRSVERAESVLETSFEQSQLERTNRILDMIEERIHAITTEQRAPGQIVPLTRAVVSVVPGE